jgi:thioredoxin reductase
MIAAEPRVLQCGVVGAGIAGLAAAIALSNAGHEVEIFERSQFKHEIGAAVTMTPNAGLVRKSPPAVYYVVHVVSFINFSPLVCHMCSFRTNPTLSSYRASSSLAC